MKTTARSSALKNKTMYHLYENGEKVGERPDKNFKGYDMKRKSANGSQKYTIREKHLKVKTE